MRGKNAAIWFVATVNVLLLCYGLAAIPAPAVNRVVLGGVRFMNLNVQQFLAETDKVESNLDAVAGLLRTENPDVVALQESETNSLLGANQNGMLWLSAKTGLRYFYGLPSSTYTPGVGLLSRWPIVEPIYFELPSTGSIQRGAIRAVVQSPEGRFAVVVGHLQWAEEYLPGEPTAAYWRDQSAQANALISLAAGAERVAVLGDFNAGPGYPGPAYDLFRERFLDSWVEAGNGESDKSGYTWPASAPSMRIDFVWLSRSGWKVRDGSARVVGNRTLSDHRAFLVDAAFTDTVP